MTAERIGQPRFLTIEETMAFHSIAIREYGGSLGLRDRGALESALAMPRQSIGGDYAHNFPFMMAAAYAFHIAKNHPFVDGNKRVALLCCTTFLRLNCYSLASEGAEAADAILTMLDPSVGGAGKDKFAAWFESSCRELPRLELRDFLLGVRLDDCAEFAESVVGGGRSQEAQRSTSEAARAIPLIEQLERQAEVLLSIKGEDNDQRARALLYCSVMLVSFHRLAEEMGYEW